MDNILQGSKIKSTISFFLSNRLIIDNSPKAFRDIVKARLTLENPAWIENERMNRWNGETARFLRFYRETDSGLVVPRGFISQIISLCRSHNLNFRLDDKRRTLPPVDFTFKGELRPDQMEAAQAMLARDFGLLVAGPGTGKTVIALFLIAQRKQPALIVVHTKELLHQWVDRIETFLDIPKGEIGVIGDGKKRIGKKITVATVQSLVKIADQVAPYIGHLIVDEAHHTPSKSFTEVAAAFGSKYMAGLSATPYRRDGLSKLIFLFIGDVVHKIEKQGLPFEVVTKETDFQSSFDPSAEYSKMLSELTQDPRRNGLIADVVKEASLEARDCLASDRSEGARAHASGPPRKAGCEGRSIDKRLPRQGKTGYCRPAARGQYSDAHCNRPAHR